MGHPSRKERRLGDRKKLTGLLPGRLQTAAGVDIDCKLVDISTFGMGIIFDQEMDAGNLMELVMKDQTISLQVAWVQRDFCKQDLFRYGLSTLDPSINLEEIFVAAGCLK